MRDRRHNARLVIVVWLVLLVIGRVGGADAQPSQAADRPDALSGASLFTQAGVQKIPYGVHQGAGLRVAGQVRQSDNFTGDSSWRELRIDFQVAGAVQEVEFICELRACAGEAWFAIDSLRVVQIR